MSVLDYRDLVEESAKKYNVWPPLIFSMIEQESGGDPNALSEAGAMGLMQLMPDTAKELGVEDAYDPAQNIDAGVRYFSEAAKYWGDSTNRALGEYNSGRRTVDERYGGTDPTTWREHPNFGIPWEDQGAFAQEQTVDYVNRIHGIVPKYAKLYDTPSQPEEVKEETRRFFLPGGREVQVPAHWTNVQAYNDSRLRYPDYYRGMPALSEERLSPEVQEEDQANIFEAFTAGVAGSGLDAYIGKLFYQADKLPEGSAEQIQVFDELEEVVRFAGETRESIAPNMLHLDDVVEAYEKDGAIDAVAKFAEMSGETFAHSMGWLGAGTLAGFGGKKGVGKLAGKLLAGTAAAGPLGTVASTLASITQYSTFLGMMTLQYTGQALERGVNDGKLSMEDYDTLKIALGALGSGALDMVTGAVATPRIWINGLSNAQRVGLKKAYATGVMEVAKRLDRQGPFKRMLAAGITEGAVEVGQSAIQRASLGMEISPHEEEVMDEYVASFMMGLGPGVGMGGVGALYTGHKKKQRRKVEEFLQGTATARNKSARMVEKLRQEITARLLEEAGVQAADAPSSGQEFNPTADDVHKVSDERNILHDNDPAFMAFSRRLTGKIHLDDMTPSEILKVYNAISAMPVQETETQLQLVSNEEAIELA